MSAELTTQEVADLLGVSIPYVHTLRKDKRLEARRPRGGQWLYDPSSVAALRAEWAASPPRRGRPALANPSPSALAKRRSRARQAEGNGEQLAGD